MTAAVASVMAIAASARWFAAFCALGSIVAIVVLLVLEPFDPPVRFGVLALAYFGPLGQAAMRFKKRHRLYWTMQTRNWLSLIYAIAGLVIYAAAIAVLAAVGFPPIFGFIDELTNVTNAAWLVGFALIYAAGARLILELVAHERGNS